LKRLALRGSNGGALADEDAFDGCSTAPAGLAGSVHIPENYAGICRRGTPQSILAPLRRIPSCNVLRTAVSSGVDSPVLGWQARRQGVQTGPVERLVGIDVSHAGKEGLVEEQGF